MLRQLLLHLAVDLEAKFTVSGLAGSSWSFSVDTHGDWKVMFLEQRAHGFEVWAEPFVPLRVPRIFNLRSDPLERAIHESWGYQKWLFDHIYMLVPAQAITQKFMSTFAEFPPRQKAASFSIEQADKVITEAATSGH